MLSASTKKSLATALAGAALASALVVSGASAHYGFSSGHTYQDLRSPDAADAARAAANPPPPSSIAASVGKEYQDLRSPDTRDVAEGSRPTPAQQPVVDEPSEPSGFDLVSAAIGAVAAAALSLMLMATLSIRRPTGGRAASA
jgi:hypothetical protein